MISEYIKGNIVHMLGQAIENGHKFYMAQGCNCMIKQSSGVAGQLRHFPEVFKADVKFGGVGWYSKLGKKSIAVLGKTNNAVVYNLYTQYIPTVSKRAVNYSAVACAFRDLEATLGHTGETLFIPRIGAGLAGGDWDIIKVIIDDATPTLDIIVVDFVPEYVSDNVVNECAVAHYDG